MRRATVMRPTFYGFELLCAFHSVTDKDTMVQILSFNSRPIERYLTKQIGTMSISTLYNEHKSNISNISFVHRIFFTSSSAYK